MSHPLDNDIKFLTGVGEMRANLLRSELGIQTIGDLLRHYPYRYLDRSRVLVLPGFNMLVEEAKNGSSPLSAMGQESLNWSGSKESTGSKNGSKWDANTSSSDAPTFSMAS